MPGRDERHQRGRDLGRILTAATLDPAPVLGCDEGRQPCAIVVRGDRSEAASADHRDTGAFGFDSPACLAVVGRADEMLFRCADLQRQRALSSLRDQLVRVEAVPDLCPELEPVEPAGRENDRVEPSLPAFAQTRVDVAAHGLDRKCRFQGQQLGLPPDRRRAHPHPGTQVRGATERVARVLPLQIRPNRKAFGIGRRHVLRGMHRDVDAAVEQRLLQFLDEDATRSDLAERTRPVPIARRGDGNERDLDARPAQPGRSELGLREREPTAAGTDADQHGTSFA
jgi:hypothetical protein